MSDTFCLNALPADEEPVPIEQMVPARGSAGNVNYEAEEGLGRRPGDKRAAEKVAKKNMLMLANRVDAELDVCVTFHFAPHWRTIRGRGSGQR